MMWIDLNLVVDVLLHRKLQNRQDCLHLGLGLYLLEDIGRLSNLEELVVVQQGRKTNHQHHHPVKYHQVLIEIIGGTKNKLRGAP